VCLLQTSMARREKSLVYLFRIPSAHRTSKYLNNMIEQDHRKAPQRCYPMLGFKTFVNAEVTLSGIELTNKIKKGQFDTSEIISPRAMILQVWEAVLAA
jgi:transposase-like protein